MQLPKKIKRMLFRWVVHNIWQGYSAYDIVVDEIDRKQLRQEALSIKQGMLLQYIQKRVAHESMAVFPKAKHPDDLLVPQAQILTVMNLIPAIVEEILAETPKAMKPKYNPLRRVS